MKTLHISIKMPDPQSEKEKKAEALKETLSAANAKIEAAQKKMQEKIAMDIFAASKEDATKPKPPPQHEHGGALPTPTFMEAVTRLSQDGVMNIMFRGDGCAQGKKGNQTHSVSCQPPPTADAMGKIWNPSS